MSNWLIYSARFQPHLLLIKLLALILIQRELKPTFPTLLVILSLTSSIISYFNIIFIFILSLYDLILLGTVHTGVEIHRKNLEMNGLVEQPWPQLICCTVCLPCGCNFRWWEEVWDGSECWLVCRCWTLEIEFNKSLSSSIIRLANYSVTTSLIYKWKV